MKQHQEIIEIHTRKRGLIDITNEVSQVIARGQMDSGLCTIFIRHTSSSLVIQENADPSARYDLERFMERIAPEDDPSYTHTAEGSDDMPAHLRSMLTNTSEQIPITAGRLALGTWQGLYLFEHRRGYHRREIVIHSIGQ
jgi:secondary thiamine-phosphate synthase enzyme